MQSLFAALLYKLAGARARSGHADYSQNRNVVSKLQATQQISEEVITNRIPILWYDYEPPAGRFLAKGDNPCYPAIVELCPAG